jgi:hypothetical protein
MSLIRLLNCFFTQLQYTEGDFVGILHMRRFLKSTLVAVALGASTMSASAAVNLVGSIGFDGAPAAGESMVMDFDSPISAGFSYVGGILPFSIPGVAAAPALDATLYGFAAPGFDATFQSNSGSLSSMSFYLGSLDTYNTISFFNGATLIDSFTGADLALPANGDQGAANTNRRFFFTFGAADSVNRVVFNTTQPAFEFDNIAAAISGVPEPSTWAMMIMGFGLIGFTLRNGRRQVAKPVRI